ncbi:hypothetical protein HGRIS_002720 [Hohenbuehelia grisea]|uniref:Conserved oligomeric Golgi complex subunit 2 n=1 Tax=Hohenbuehelia grisea TaxID=104357 RepID=A0ABR3JMK2_9AGAR
MDALSPTSDSGRDPFQLERLAEELAQRETTKPGATSPTLGEGEDAAHDLPAYVPLSHENPYLQAKGFSVEEFLLSRSYTSLPDLRSELRDYLADLKEELVKLINDDYEAFISLSTDLRDEGDRLERLKAPLGAIKSSILESKKELNLIQEDIQDKLQKRAKLREEKAILHLLLKISESITRIESLLLISAPADEVNGTSDGVSGSALAYNSQLGEVVDDRTQATQAKHLSRVTTEYTQLLYHASKAREDKCVFVDKMQWRIDRIQSTLSADLDHLFAATLKTLIDGKEETKLADMDRAKLLADLTECLRIYDTLGLWQDAEEILRTQVVREFVKKTIFPGTLTAPHSPIVPHTPFLSPAPAFPRTPFTPFTAFKPPSLDSGRSPSSPYAQMLNDRDDPLARLYSQILRFVERDLSRIMEIAEQVAIKSTTDARQDGLLSDTTQVMDRVREQGDEGFHIMANVVWAELGSSIMDELGNVIFASGRPNEFRQHYETSQAFIRSLEYLAPSIRAVDSMRAHPTYAAFQHRWQLPVYFQLRWKDIVSKLETSLAVTRIDPSLTADNPFLTSQATAVWTAISACWSADVYIPELSHRFWKLTLQIISRYRTWLGYVSAETAGSTSNSTLPPGVEKLNSSSSAHSRSSTPAPATEAQSPESIAADDAVLRQHATIISDIRNMRTTILSSWRQEISMMIPQSNDISDTSFSAEDALQDVLSSLSSVIPPLSNQVVRILTRRCCDALLPVRSIPSQFRAMSNKRMPAEASYFVTSILQPVKLFFGIGASDRPGAYLKDDYLEAYASEIFDSVSQRYIHYLTHMRKTEESLRRLKKGKKATFSLFGSSNSKEDDGKDEARIRAQMILDVEAFGKDGQSIGIKPERSEAFSSLTELVQTPLPED